MFWIPALVGLGLLPRTVDTSETQNSELNEAIKVDMRDSGDTWLMTDWTDGGVQNG